MKIDYEEVCNFYGGICNAIFNEIDIFYPNKYEGLTVKYSDEYLKAYSHLHNIVLQLDELHNMKDYYNEKDFKYFGLEILYGIRYKINNYLKATDIEFEDSIYSFIKYDDIYKEYEFERLTSEASEKFAYYEAKLLQQNDYDYILNSLTMLSDDVKNIREEIKKSKYIKHKHNKKLNKINKLIKEIIGDVKNDM